jgi:type II secretory pathway pseudopilin PulG
MRRGFSLLESILSLTVFLMVVLAGLESFDTARRVFFRLQENQESRMAVQAAIEKIRSEILRSGRGLAGPLRLGLVSGIEPDEDAWVFWSAETAIPLAQELGPGQAFLAVGRTEEALSAGRMICLFDGDKGETAVIRGVDESGVFLEAPISGAYPAGRTALIVLRRVSIFLDANNKILRRKVNASSAQPLLEGVSEFSLDFGSASSRIVVRVTMEGKREIGDERTIVAKNLALAGAK